MDPVKSKFIMKGLNPGLAQRLINAGLSNQASVSKATDKELLALPGVGPAALAEIRKKIG